MKKIVIFLAIALFLLVIYVAGRLWILERNSHALWNIISQKCMPHQQNNHSPAPCLKVDLAGRYVVFKDAKGPLHTLLLPTDKITGIESPKILETDAPDYFGMAWRHRNFLKMAATRSINDTYLSLAINSRYARSQNQLHIHLACLKPEVYRLINQHASEISHQWKPLSTTILGHRYLAVKTSDTVNPFAVLNHYVRLQNDEMENYGLARIITESGEIILLANRLHFTNFNLGSAEEIQDDSCALIIRPVG